ncbi:MAG: hypothetical protein U5J78_06905 [Parasphingorhabdus sp.]|nr:hypothetical protein [Parasphingorhabdus sp.]
MMAMRPDAKALLLHAPIEGYLRSIAKKEMWGRIWVRDVLIGTAKDGYLVGSFSTEELLKLTDLQVAALGWLSQHKLYAQIAEKFGPDRVRIIDSDTFLANQKPVLRRLAQFFDIDLTAGQIDAIITGPAFTTHSKDAVAFDADLRRDEQATLASLHGAEIDMVAKWAIAVAENQEIDLEPATALLR